jgi:phospholipid/cholesterol/gamma-HCH transport system substrate-binding protein
VRLAIQKHLGDFIALIAVAALAIGTGGYILHQERLRFPLVQEKPFQVKVELPNAQAVQPGQGQTVRVAGVKVGDIGKVNLENGIAVVTLDLDHKYKGLIREDATALLRTKTGLKDMFLEVDPGMGRPLPENGRINVQNSQQDVDPDEFLAVLDADTRDYLKLLISGAGKGLKGRGSDLREVFARLGPVHRDLARFTRGIARRRANLRRLIHNYGILTTELGNSDRDIVRLVRASNVTLGAFAAENQNISAAVSKLPGTLRVTRDTLRKVGPYADELGPTLEALRPAFRKLDTANKAVLPLVKEGEPIIRKQIRPFTRIAQPFTRDLGNAAGPLAKANPDLATDFGELNRFFNIGAFNPGGAEGLSGSMANQQAREEGYLYWLGWVAQVTVSLFNQGDAQGPVRRISLGGVSCSAISSLLTGAGVPDALITPAIDVLGPGIGGVGICS